MAGGGIIPYAESLIQQNVLTHSIFYAARKRSCRHDCSAATGDAGSKRRGTMTQRLSHAIWNGTLKDGNGTMLIGNAGFAVDYTFLSRFENGAGTNPEELIGAAHAGCFSMALSHQIEAAGFKPDKISTRATVHLGKSESGFSIDRIELDTEGQVPGISAEQFTQQAEAAKANCPVSRALAGVEITLKANLLSSS
jgi:lipoyl-dependent peroxiredoxin